MSANDRKSAARRTPDLGDITAWRESLGKRLRGLRKERKVGTTQAQVAQEIPELTYKKYSRIEQGATEPSLSEGTLLSRYYGTSLDHLAGETELSSSAQNWDEPVEWKLGVSPEHDDDRKAIRCFELAAKHRSADDIAQELGLAKDRAFEEVSKLLKDATDRKLVLIKDVEWSRSDSEELTTAIRQEARKPPRDPDDTEKPREAEAYVVKLGHAPGVYKSDVVGYLASRLLLDERNNTAGDFVVGLVGGFLVSRATHSLRRGELKDAKVYPLALHPPRGHSQVSSSSLAGEMAYLGEDDRVNGASLSITRKSEMTIVLKRGAQADVVLLGMGSLRGGPSRRLASLLTLYDLNPDELRKEGAVGDVLGYPIDEHGELVRADKIAAHGWAVHPEALRQLVRLGKSVIAIVTGKQKAYVALGALRGGFINTIVGDNEFKDAFMELIEEERRKGARS